MNRLPEPGDHIRTVAMPEDWSGLVETVVPVTEIVDIGCGCRRVHTPRPGGGDMQLHVATKRSGGCPSTKHDVEIVEAGAA